VGTMPLIGAGPSAPLSGSVMGDLFSQALGDTATLTITITCRLYAAGFAASPGGTITKSRISVRGPVTKIYIGHAAGSGDLYDATSLTQVFFSGGASLSQGNSSTTESDDIAFLWNGTSDVIVSMYMDNLTFNYVSGLGANISDTSYLLGVDEASFADKTGYTTISNSVYGVSKFSVDGY